MHRSPRHIHTEQLQQQLADSTSRQEQAMQKYEQALENARELGGRLKQLEDDLENKQVEVEEVNQPVDTYR
jgi:chromosome segregation ATPase